MPQDFIPGFAATITIDGIDQTLVIENGGLTRTRSVLSKGSMDGTGYTKSIPGPVTGTVDINGHIDQLVLNDLETAWDKGEVPFVMEISEGRTQDAFYTMALVLSQFNVATTEAGNWAFTLSGQTTGEIPFTPAVA